MRKGLAPVERPPLLFRTVQDAIKQYVITNNLQAGDPLPAEGELSAQLGVSRTSVREAIKALESVGMLEVRRGSGVFVRAFSLEPLLENLSYGMLSELRELDELLEVRRALEVGMISGAMAAITPEDIAALREIVAKMRERAGRGEPFLEEDRRFHQVLFASLGNHTLQRLLDIFWLTFRQAARHVDIADDEPLRTAQAHADILDALEAADREQAQRALDAHYAGIKARLARAQQGGAAA
jgi:DNA-binding FadR family transcriptional regulator